MKVDPSLIHRLFYPQVPLVMSASRRGRVSSMPVVSYLCVSDSPPVVAVSCRKGGFTCGLAVEAGSFSLCVLDDRFTQAVARLGSTGGSGVKDKLAAAGLRHRRGNALGAPIILGAAASLECSLRSRTPVGDHLLLFGEVRSASAAPSFRKFWNYAKYRPILYAGWRDGLTTYAVP